MSRIKDLEIRGIRNFGDERAKVLIHFSKPLTLILGPNGTGKTTIIEALKFVTSGEYPPDSDRGKSFVHEPKLTLNHTVRGQVKAKILDKSGQELVIIRTMQVSRQKTGALKFQALDNTITRLDARTKDKIQITNRCSDIDREMLAAMGVSKPILNYVIFCHQEESNWPLEDGKKLKDRFDEIFDTSKYNKAMDTITKLIKDLNSEINTLKAREEAFKEILNEAEDQESKLRNNEQREKEVQDKITVIDQSVVPLEERMKQILDVKSDYQKLEDQLNKVETDYKVTNNYIESLKKHIKQLHTGSKEELVDKLDSYDQNLTQKVTIKKKSEEKLEETEHCENTLLKKLADARIKLGSLTQKKIAFDEKITKRNELLKKAFKTWEIPQVDSVTEEEAKDYIERISRKVKEFSIAMKKRAQEFEQEEKHVQREVDACRSEKTGIDSEMSLKEKERGEIKFEINTLRKKIKQVDEDGGRLDSLEADLQNATENFNTVVQNFDEKFIRETLEREASNKKEFNNQLNNIDNEINFLNKQSSQQAELELHQNSLLKKEEEISVLRNKNESNLNLLFSNAIPQQKLKDSLEKIQKSLSAEKTNLLKQIEEGQQKFTTYKTTLKHKESELSKTVSELEACKEKVAFECQENDYDEMLALQERKVKALNDQRGIYASQSSMYEEYLKILKKKSCCPLCDRGFHNSSEENSLEQKLHSEIRKSPQALKDCEKELKQEQARYDALQQLKPVRDQIREIENNKLPKLRTDVEKIKNQLQDSEQSLETLRLILSEPEEKLCIYKSIIGDVILLDSYINQRDHLTQTIETKKREMARAGKVSDRTMQEAQDERQKLKDRLSAVERNVDKAQLALQSGQEKVSRAREQKNKLNEEVLKIRQGQQESSQLKDKVNDLYKKETYLENSLKSLRQNLVIADEELESKVQELNDLKRKNREKQESDMNFKSISGTEFHELSTVQKEVQEVMASKLEENLEKIETDVEKTKTECDKMKAEKARLEEHIRFLDEQCRSQEVGKKDLENNLDLIKKQEFINDLNIKITKYRTTLENMQFNKLRKEYQELQEKKDKFEKEKNEYKGALGELEIAIRNYKKSLNQEKYRMARHNYKEKQLQVVVQEEAVKNLKEYVTVLDKAMIQFHEERMNTVNKIMRQLWQLIYSGSDTTSIQIRVQTTEGIGDKKRSYNYKLVQVKRSAEMDMKGKCSAGQKVLASIIIRMALAETFCSDCAVLALDEPTTNLDDENATNLAVTLSKVIQLRAQNHKNFQLIVISHDEKFISSLSNLSGKQMFQELYRNPEGYSLVKRRDMSDYIKNSSQSVADEDYDESEEEQEQAIEPKNPKKRNLTMDDSPPHGRAVKRRAFH
ncbi:DNA repair protein RAD50 [Nasonia vitripennis]|uniref:Zinc-hook domain-containing protein n=1 Tax=Nasonia vitripennis TaxID=7425 RepID=A0A7M7G1L1_NASVI|nr:DNA repair protein RAD50 [Nasonia vitripennis]